VIFTANKQHLDLIKQGGKVWNRWRETTSLTRPDLSGANLKKVDLRNVDLSGSDLMGANLREANLNWTNFRKANLRKANLCGANLREANLREANLGWADFSGADLKRACLRQADLSWANLKEAILREADLREAKLSWADLREADLREVNLREANLREAYLSNANFREADLGEADLSEADLRGTRLFKANLERANLSGCHIYGVSAWNADINETTGQSNLIITDWDEPMIAVDNLEVAQFIQLLLHSKKIGSVMHGIRAQAVLIMGCFTLERKMILDVIREELRKHDYLPVFFDLQKPHIQNFMEMMFTLARMVRFILADFTDLEVALEIVPGIVRAIAVPVQPLLTKKIEPEPTLLSTLRKHHKSVLDTYWYTDSQDLCGSFRQHVIVPAEAKIKELKEG
jgi:uncharacterized protein YjbI with pentapeptide repeats